MLQAANNIGIDSTLDFHIYALAISGAILLFMGIVGFGADGGSRLLSLVVGLIALGYGAFLAFVHDIHSDYWIHYGVYALPVVVIINAFRSAKAARAAKQHQQQP
jgi:hypothetical protein